MRIETIRVGFSEEFDQLYEKYQSHEIHFAKPIPHKHAGGEFRVQHTKATFPQASAVLPESPALLSLIPLKAATRASSKCTARSSCFTSHDGYGDGKHDTAAIAIAGPNSAGIDTDE